MDIDSLGKQFQQFQGMVTDVLDGLASEALEQQRRIDKLESLLESSHQRIALLTRELVTVKAELERGERNES